MKIKTYALFMSIALSATIVVYAQQAQATLGGSEDSITSDREALSAVRRTTMIQSNYTVHEIASGSTVVREYVSADGVVFGIAWNGLIHPDLTQLLGAYAGEYHAALKQTPREPGRRRLRVKANHVVVEKWGHMRNLQGRAYVPALVPPGVRIDEIR